MKEPATKAELLQMVENGRTQLNALISQIDEAKMLEPGVEENGSIKDILAHMTAWEVKMSEVFVEVTNGRAPTNWPTTDEAVDHLNADFYAANRDKPLAQVMSEFEASYLQVVTAVQALSEDELFDPNRFEWREGRPLWYMVAGNTFGHYGDHLPNIEGWLLEQ